MSDLEYRSRNSSDVTSDRVTELARTLSRQMNRRGFLGMVAKGAAIATGAAAGLFQFAGVFGTSVQEAFACYYCWYNTGNCACKPSGVSWCDNADRPRSCRAQDYSWNCVRAICYGGHFAISCPYDCAWCDPCNPGPC